MITEMNFFSGGGEDTVEYYKGTFEAPASGTIHVDVPFEPQILIVQNTSPFTKSYGFQCIYVKNPNTSEYTRQYELANSLYKNGSTANNGSAVIMPATGWGRLKEVDSTGFTYNYHDGDQDATFEFIAFKSNPLYE